MTTKHDLAALKAALEHVRSMGVEAWDLLAYAMAESADEEARQAIAEDPDSFGADHDGLAQLETEADAEADDPGMGLNLISDARRLYRLTHGL